MTWGFIPGTFRGRHPGYRGRVRHGGGCPNFPAENCSKVSEPSYTGMFEKSYAYELRIEAARTPPPLYFFVPPVPFVCFVPVVAIVIAWHVMPDLYGTDSMPYRQGHVRLGMVCYSLLWFDTRYTSCTNRPGLSDVMYARTRVGGYVRFKPCIHK